MKFLKHYLPFDKKSHEWPQIFGILLACLGGFSRGALFVWTSPSIPILISNSSHLEPITLEEASYFTVIPPFAAIVSNPFIAVLVDAIGRKKMVLLLGIPHFSSWMLIAFSKNLYMFYASRFLTGVGEAFIFNALPTYVAEISTPHVRGFWGNYVAISMFFGQFMVNVVGAYCDIRTTALIFCAFPIMHSFLVGFLPESPYFLLMKGRTEEARKSLQKWRWTENVDEEFAKLTGDVKRQTSESGTLKDVFVIPTNRKALLISIGIRGCQQFSGLPAFAVYTQFMFNQAGGNFSASTSAIIFSGVLLVAITISAFFVDKFGRRKLMMFSSIGAGAILAIEGVYFHLDKEFDYDMSSLKWMPLIGMIVYLIICSSGLAIIPTLMMGELFSASIKGKAMCILNISFSLYILSVSKMFQTLTSNFGMYVPFYLFSVCCYFSAVFAYLCIPETKGKTLEEIQQSLKGNRYSKPSQETVL